MRSYWTVSGLIGLLALPTAAQTPPEDRPAQPPSAERRAVEREPSRPAAIFERLPDQLELDQSQRAQYDQIVAAYREKLAAQRESQAQTAEWARKLREARQAGEEEQVRQLREQMRSRRGTAGRDVMQSFFDEVEKILRDDQKEKLGNLRDRAGQLGPRGERRPRQFVAPEQQIAQLRERLDLNPQQCDKFDALAAELKHKLAVEGQPAIADLMQQLREAYVAGDREEAVRLREAIGQRRGEVEKQLNEFAAQLEPTLSEDQKQRFAEFRAQALRGTAVRAADDKSLRGDPRMLLRAVRRLDLSQEQKDQVRALEDDVTRKLRETGREATASIRADLEKQLRTILTPDQNTQLGTIMERQQRSGGSSRRAAAPDDPARPSGPPAAEDP